MDRDEAAFDEGCQAARVDVAAGRLVYRWSGHAGHWGHWIATQLAERFDTQIEGLGICLMTAASVSFDDGYNSVVTEEIERRHGPGTLPSLFEEARRQSEECLWDAKHSWLKHHLPDYPR